MVEGIKRKIPDNMNPWSCEINGVRYEYEAGSEQDVPEEVAHIIDAYWKSVEPVEGGSGGFDGPGGDAVKPFPVRNPSLYRDDIYIEDLEHDTFYFHPRKYSYEDYSATLVCGIPGASYTGLAIRAGEIYYFCNLQTDQNLRYLILIGYNSVCEARLIDGKLNYFTPKYNTNYIDAKHLYEYKPSHPWNPANKKYVDDAIAEYVNNIPDAPQADWNQNDPTAPDFVKNRTHWVEGGGVTVLPTTELVYVEDFVGLVVPDPFELTSGNEYVVKLTSGENSHEFTTMCTDMPENEDGVKWVLGDIGLLDGEPVTGEPFVILVFDPAFAAEAGMGAIVIAGEATSISIDGVGEVVHKIDPKFLPDGAGGPVVYTYDGDSGMVINMDGSEVTVEQAKKDALNVIIYEGHRYLRPICVNIDDGSVVFAVKPPWDEEYEVVVGERPR